MTEAIPVPQEARDYFSKLGKIGGAKSRRTVTKKEARRVAALSWSPEAREKRRLKLLEKQQKKVEESSCVVG